MSDPVKEQEKLERKKAKERSKFERKMEKLERKQAEKYRGWDEETHRRMSRAGDPQDADGDGVVTPAEAAAYITETLQHVPERDRAEVLEGYFRSLNDKDRADVAGALQGAPDHPSSVAEAYEKARKAAAEGRSPLESALGSDAVKAGLIGLATVLGTKALDSYRASLQAKKNAGVEPVDTETEQAQPEPASGAFNN